LTVADKNVSVNAVGTNFMNYPGFKHTNGADKDPKILEALLEEIPVGRLGETREAAHFTMALLDGYNMYTTKPGCEHKECLLTPEASVLQGLGDVRFPTVIPAGLDAVHKICVEVCIYMVDGMIARCRPAGSSSGLSRRAGLFPGDNRRISYPEAYGAI
jgi:hypothetical protein